MYATCRNWKTMQNVTYDKLMGEPYRLAILGDDRDLA
jgi:hypothetical protein